MVIPVGRLAPTGQWDQNLLEQLLTNQLYPTGLDFKWHEGYPNTDGFVLLCPGKYWAEHIPEIEDAVASKKWLLLIRTSDEEDWFDVTQFAAPPNTRVWLQYPRPTRDYGDATFFGVGFPKHFNDPPKDPPDKSLDVFLSCQRTHTRREQAFEALKDTHLAIEQRVFATEGFTQGMDPAEYARCMVSAKVAPCPSGAVSPDSFRLYEALESHAIPIVDAVSPVDGFTEYWEWLYPDAPFPVITNYPDLPGWIEDLLAGWPANANRIVAWWMRYKRQLAHWLVEDLQALGAS